MRVSISKSDKTQGTVLISPGLVHYTPVQDTIDMSSVTVAHQTVNTREKEREREKGGKRERERERGEEGERKRGREGVSKCSC